MLVTNTLKKLCQASAQCVPAGQPFPFWPGDDYEEFHAAIPRLAFVRDNKWVDAGKPTLTTVEGRKWPAFGVDKAYAFVPVGNGTELHEFVARETPKQQYAQLHEEGDEIRTQIRQ